MQTEHLKVEPTAMGMNGVTEVVTRLLPGRASLVPTFLDAGDAQHGFSVCTHSSSQGKTLLP